MRTLSILLASALATLPAFAVQPGEHTESGISPERVLKRTGPVQRVLHTSSAWLDFAQNEGQGWRARFDEVTQSPRVMWGPGLDLGPASTEAQVVAAAEMFVDTHTTTLGLDNNTWALKSVAYDEAMDTWFVDFTTYQQGIAIAGEGVRLRFRGGKLSMIVAETYPGSSVTGEGSISPNTALNRAKRDGLAPTAKHTLGQVTGQLLPVRTDDGFELRRVWRTTSHTDTPIGDWESFVDQQTGSLLYQHNTLNFVEYIVMGRHDARRLTESQIVSPMPFIRVSPNSDGQYADANGVFNAGDVNQFEVSLSGQFLRVYNDQGGQSAMVTPNPSDEVIMDSALIDGNAGPVITVYYYVDQIRKWWRERSTTAETDSWTTKQTDITVNYDDSCNAFYTNSSMTFFRADDECQNTGRLADVIYHEWGHGLHQHLIVSGGYDRSMGEGVADVVSFLMTDDHNLAPDFYNAADSGPLRDALNQKRYPDNFTPGEDNIHANGTIFSGAMWDFREALRANYGEPYATDTTAEILKNMLKAGPTHATAYEEAIFADDDNNNLLDGTPHLIELAESFGGHGFGPLGGQLQLGHSAAAEPEAGVPLEIEVTIDQPYGDALPITAESGKLWYREAGGFWNSVDVDLENGGTGAIGELPGFDMGSVVEYYMELETAYTTLTTPSGGRTTPYTFLAGNAIEVFCENFDAGDGGFIVEGDNPGANLWQFGIPQGVAGDPSEAYTGERIWATNLSGEYGPGGQGILRSPTLETGHYRDLVLSYRRWLTVEGNESDQANVLLNNKGIWNNAESSVHVDEEWASHVVSLRGNDSRGRFTLGFELNTGWQQQYGGWNIDDICIYAPASPDNRLGITGITATRRSDDKNVELTWNNPLHGPVQTVRVVRKKGAWPTSHTDGDVVAEFSNPDLGSIGNFVDPKSKGGKLFYAVYATDGTDWLSWTEVGDNAINVVEGGGCSTTGSSPAGLMPLLLPFGLMGLRRRRSA